MNTWKVLALSSAAVACLGAWLIARQGLPRQAAAEPEVFRGAASVEPAQPPMPPLPVATVKEFRDRLRHAGPAMVEFTATWCPYCRKEAPTLQQLAREYHGRVQFISVDIDAMPEVAREFGVTGIPTVMFAVDGQTQAVLTGYREGGEIRSALDAMLRGAK